MNLRRLFQPTALAVAFLAGATTALAHSANEPAPRPEDGWQRRHRSINENVAAAGTQAKVIFIGDSITQGWEGAGKEVWARYYGPRNAVNLGIGGDRTQHVLWRLQNGNLAGLKPKAAVLMIGTNNSNGEDNTVEQIADGITAIVQYLRAQLSDTKVLLVPIFPRSENPTPQRGKILQVNQIIQKLTEDPMIEWVDFGHRFLRPDGSIPRDLMPDFLHLSPAGYEIWATSLEGPLSRALGENPVSAAQTANLSGDWIAAIPGPNGEPVDVPFSLKQEGNRITGKVSRADGRFMTVEKGTIDGQTFSWTMKRDRPDGSIMTYELSGTVQGDKLQGKSRAEMDGNPITIEWTARRR